MPTAWCRVNNLCIFAIMTIILKFATLSDFAPHLTAPRFSRHGFLSFSLLLSLSRELLRLHPPSFPSHYTLLAGASQPQLLSLLFPMGVFPDLWGHLLKCLDTTSSKLSPSS